MKAYVYTDLRHWGHPLGYTAQTRLENMAESARDKIRQQQQKRARTFSTRNNIVDIEVSSHSDDDERSSVSGAYSPSAKRVFDSEAEETLSEVSRVRKVSGIFMYFFV